MEYDEERNSQTTQWWVEYIDDYNTKHLAPVQDKTYLNFLQENYSITNIEIVTA